MVASISACSLIQVDPEKDAKRVVIKTKDEDILKGEYNKYLAYYEMMYSLNGYTVPTEGEELDTFREDVLNTMVDVYLLKKEAQADALEVDVSTVEDEVQSYIESYITGFETEEKYVAFIEGKNLTREEFESFLQQFIEDITYANGYNEHFLETATENKEEEWAVPIAEVDGNEIYKDQFYYKLMEMEFFYYSTYGQGLPTDEESLSALYKQIVDGIIQSYLIRQDGENQNKKISDSDIEAKVAEIKGQYEAFVPDENLDDYLNSYYLDRDKYDELVKLDSKTQLYIESIQGDLEKEIDVTDEDIKDYYDENKESYNTVSAKHILTEDEDLANQISEEITDADSFEKAFEKYSDDENIKEASDLGAFTFSTMVTEFATAAFNMEKGEVTESPVKTDFGYHIIYVYDKANPTLEDKSEEIKSTLTNTQLSTKYSEYTDKLISDAKVDTQEIKEPFEVLMDSLKEKYEIKTYPKRVV